MRSSIIFTVLFTFLIGVAHAQTQELDQESNTKSDIAPVTEAISVVDFGPKNVIGHFGHPLGTIVHVTGKAVDGVVVPAKELGIDFRTVAHDGFHYRRLITIHKSLK